MTYPKAYEPVQGQMYQILCRERCTPRREWDHCDYAENRKEKDYLIDQYNSSYRGGFEFKAILLPKKYWGKRDDI